MDTIYICAKIPAFTYLIIIISIENQNSFTHENEKKKYKLLVL